MPCQFTIKSGVEFGMTPVHIRARSKPLGVDIRQVLPFEVDAKKWVGAHKSPKALTAFRATEYGKEVFGVLDAIADGIEEQFRKGVVVSTKQAKKIFDDVIFAKQKEQQRLEAEAKAAAAEEAKRVTLNKFIKQYIADVESGARQTDKGTRYAASTVKAIKQSLVQFEEFQKAKHKRYDFDDINLKFYQDYTAWLREKNYAVNSIGKCIKELKVIMFTAESEGYHHNNLWKDKRFKGTRVEVDSIYLPKEDLKKIMEVDCSKLSPGHDLARDIFMVGVWTAQRVSDYNNIRKEDIETYTKKWIEEYDDPEHPGEKLERIARKDVTYINIRQKKTGAKVAVPCSSDLKRIFEKYDYQIPHLEDQVINRYIKDIAKEAGLTELVNIVKTNGGTAHEVPTPKYQLIHTHTARRTGATLMYLSGMDVYDIMKITGHSSPVMLKKYIKADELEVVDKIMDKYDYFD